MSPVDHSRTALYVRRLADLLGLRDWEVILMEEPTDEAGFITPLPGAKRAYLQLHPTFLSETPEEQRHTLVHELLHLHFHETHAILARAGTLIGTPAGLVLGQEHRNWLEHGVDAVATAVAPLLPLEVPDEQDPVRHAVR